MKRIKIGMMALMAVTMFVFASCNSGGEKKTKKESKTRLVEKVVNDTYKISLPTYFEDLDGLNDDASLQMGKELNEFYIIVIDEAADEFYKVFDDYMLEDLYTRDLSGFTDMVLESMEMDAGVFDIGEYKKLKINGLDAIQTEFYNVFNGLDIYYHFTAIESGNNFYQIMMWTLKDNKDKYENTMKDIAGSFAEIN